MTHTTNPITIHIVIGSTSSGKSEYAIKLAKKVNGEIISADSRQVYKGFALTSGQVPGRWEKVKDSYFSIANTATENLSDFDLTPPSPSLEKDQGRGWNISHKLYKGSTDRKVFVYKHIPHYCIDFVTPRRIYSVADFVTDGRKALADILLRGKTPVICGGTGHYIDALLFNHALPEVPPDLKFRKKMEKYSPEQLLALLSKKDPQRAKNIDPHNKRRLVRALEIVHHTGKPVPQISNKQQALSSKPAENYNYNNDRTEILNKTLPTHSEVIRILGSPTPYTLHAVPYTLSPIFHYLNPPQETLYKKIEKRLKQRVKQGMVEEVLLAHQKGLPWKRLDDMGLEFRHVSRFLRSSLSRRGEGLEEVEAYLETHTSLINFQGSLKNSGHTRINDSFAPPPHSNHPTTVKIFGLSTNSNHSGNILKLGSLFLKSPHFLKLFSDTKKYTKRQRTWFKRYLK